MELQSEEEDVSVDKYLWRGHPRGWRVLLGVHLLKHRVKLIVIHGGALRAPPFTAPTPLGHHQGVFDQEKRPPTERTLVESDYH